MKRVNEMKKSYLAIIMAVMMVFCLSFGAFAAEGEWSDNAADSYATAVNSTDKTVTINSEEELAFFAKQLNTGTKYDGYTINITKDLNMSAHYWTPIDTATLKDKTGVQDPQNKLKDATIDGKGHTITGIITKTGIRGPKDGSTPGDGQYCYYYTGFIGRNDADLTIKDLTFNNAEIKMTEPADGVAKNGSSSLAVVAGYSKGLLTLDNVNITNSLVEGEQKVGGFVGQGAGSVTMKKCSVTGSTFNASYQASPTIGYAMYTQYNSNTEKRSNTLTVDGIKLSGNTVNQVEVDGENYKTAANGGTYTDVFKSSDSSKNIDWFLNWCDTLYIDYSSTVTGTNAEGETFSYRGVPLAFAAEIDGYNYVTLADAVKAANDGDTIALNSDVNISSTIAFAKEEADVVTLDLQGHKITGKATQNGKGETVYADIFKITQGTLKVVDSAETKGSIESNGIIFRVIGNDAPIIDSDNRSIETKAKTATVEIGSGVNVVSKDDICVFIFGKGAKAVVAGNLTSNSDGYAVIQGNGNNNTKQYCGGTIIELNGAKVVSTACEAMYLPQTSTTTITNSEVTSTSTKYSAIGIKSGTLDIVNSKIIAEATAEYVEKVKANNSGINTEGSAICVDSNKVYSGNVVVNISGKDTVISSKNSHAIREVGTNVDVSNPTNLTKLVITDGSFTAADGKDAIRLDNKISEVTVTGGTFDPALPASITRTVTGTDTTSYFLTLADAMAKAKDGDTINLIAGNIEISEPLNTTKAVTLQGVANQDGTPATTIKAAADYSGKNAMISFQGKADAAEDWNASIKDVVIDGSISKATENAQAQTVDFGLQCYDNNTGVNETSLLTLNAENVVVKNTKNYGISVNGANFIGTGIAVEDTAGAWYSVDVGSGENVENNSNFTLVDDARNSFAKAINESAAKVDGVKSTVTVPDTYKKIVINAEGTLAWYTADAEVYGKAVNILDADGTVAGYYYTLPLALADVENGQTVKLNSDVTLADQLVFNKEAGDKVTLDLNGNDITADLTKSAVSVNEGELVITDSAETKGTISNTNGNTIRVVGNQADQRTEKTTPRNAVLTLNSGVNVVSTSGAGVGVFGNGAVANIAGNVTSKGKVAAVSGNGNRKENEDNSNTVININEGANIVSETNAALYLPQIGKVNINGGTLNGNIGIGIKAGELNIAGGSINATGKYVAEITENNNGINEDGSAILLEGNDTYAGNVKINITGGTITSANSHAVREVITKTANNFVSLSELNISGGNLTATSGKNVIEVANESAVKVSGGVFSPLLKSQITTAPLADNEFNDSGEITKTTPIELGDYTASYSGSTIYLTAKTVPYHTNGAGTEGNWVGVGISLPQYFTPAVDAKATYEFGTGKGEIPLATPDFEKNNTKYYAFYINASDAAPKTNITIDWDGAGSMAPVSYTVNLNNVVCAPQGSAAITAVENINDSTNDYYVSDQTVATLTGNNINLTGVLPYVKEDTGDMGMSKEGCNRFALKLSVANIAEGTTMSVSKGSEWNTYTDFLDGDDFVYLVGDVTDKNGQMKVVFNKDTDNPVEYTISWADAVLNSADANITEKAQVEVDEQLDVSDETKEFLKQTDVPVASVTGIANAVDPDVLNEIIEAAKPEEGSEAVAAEVIVQVTALAESSVEASVLAFEAKPMIKVGNEEAKPIANEQLAGKPITLRFALPANFVLDGLQVRHVKDNGTTEYLIPEIIVEPNADGATQAYAVVTIYDFSQIIIENRETFTVNYVSNLPTGVEFVNPNDNTEVNVTNLPYELKDPSAAGYQFTGWTVATTSQKVEPIKQISGSTINAYATADKVITLYANWATAESTVTFNSDGGTSVDAQTVAYSGKAVEPKAPTKDGYVFVGWYTTEDTLYDFTTPVTGDLTLIAKWTAMDYTVNYLLPNAQPEQVKFTAEELAAGTAKVKALPTEAGKVFKGWFNDNGETVAPETVITVNNFNADGKYFLNAYGETISYAVVFVANGGSDVDPQVVNYDGKATKPADPTREGYTFDGWFADKELTQAADFDAAVTANTTFYAKWTEVVKPDPQPTIVYEDVNSSDWFYGAVMAVTDNGCMNGMVENGKNYFKPNEATTRAQFVTMLGRCDKVDTNEYKAGDYKFTDITGATADWAGSYIAWASENKIVEGTSATTFEPGKTISRQEMATIIGRYLKYKGYDAKGDWNSVNFTDKAAVAGWAQAGVADCVATGIITGFDTGDFRPAENMSRAQGATVLSRIIELLK